MYVENYGIRLNQKFVISVDVSDRIFIHTSYSRGFCVHKWAGRTTSVSRIGPAGCDLPFYVKYYLITILAFVDF